MKEGRNKLMTSPLGGKTAFSWEMTVLDASILQSSDWRWLGCAPEVGEDPRADFKRAGGQEHACAIGLDTVADDYGPISNGTKGRDI